MASFDPHRKNTDRYNEEVVEILDALGLSEISITDATRLSDLVSEQLSAEQIANTLKQKLGIDVWMREHVCDVALGLHIDREKRAMELLKSGRVEAQQREIEQLKSQIEALSREVEGMRREFRHQVERNQELRNQNEYLRKTYAQVCNVCGGSGSVADLEVCPACRGRGFV